MNEFIINYGSWIWIGILVISCFIEAFTFGLTTIWAAIAAIPLIFIARTGLAFQWQILIFLLITLVLIIFTRPFAIKKLKTGKSKTNAETIIGQDVLITKTISNFEKGEAKAKNGVIWTAISRDNIILKKGTVCSVVSIEGNTICVEEKNEVN